jgi:AraC family transcriptional regulator
MEIYLSQPPATAGIAARPTFPWIRDVIALLDSAVRRLHHTQQAAPDTLLEAASLLRKQLDPRVAEEKSLGAGRLLAWQANKVRDYIDSHITGPMLVSDLCALIRQSEAHFSRSFKRTFGESPHAFVVRRRLDFATQYMLQSDVSLSDVALLCGFADQAHFCKHFRQATGLTPTAWRRARREQALGSTVP